MIGIQKEVYKRSCNPEQCSMFSILNKNEIFFTSNSITIIFEVWLQFVAHEPEDNSSKKKRDPNSIYILRRTQHVISYIRSTYYNELWIVVCLWVFRVTGWKFNLHRFTESTYIICYIAALPHIDRIFEYGYISIRKRKQALNKQNVLFAEPLRMSRRTSSNVKRLFT